MKEFHGRLGRHLEQGRSFVVATIVAAEGSTPRKVGTRMIVHADGAIDFTLGGGPFEALVIEDAKAEAKATRGKDKDDKEPEVGIAVAAGNAFFRRDSIQLSVKLADEQFPPYDKVIPQEQSKRVVTGRSQFISTLKRISLVASDKSGGVQLHIEPGLMKIISQNPDVGEGTEELDVDYAGENVSIGFNARYLLDALGALPYDEVALELSGGLDPGVIRPVGDGTDFVGVIMPMRI